MQRLATEGSHPVGHFHLVNQLLHQFGYVPVLQGCKCLTMVWEAFTALGYKNTNEMMQQLTYYMEVTY
jgi:hypothetical protein